MPKIFPFSAKSDLNDSEVSGFSVYKEYLSEAFDNHHINNILVTGDFGVGKSSIIRSFEKEYCNDSNETHRNKNKNGFLYLSLGDYRNTNHINHYSQSSQGTQAQNQPQSVHASQNSNDINQKDYLERRLLMQIFACFNEKDIPDSSFKLIPEKLKNPSRAFVSGGLVVLISLLTLLFIAEKFFQLLTSLNTQQVYLEHLSTVDEVKRLAECEISNINGRILFYSVVFISILILSFILIYRFLPKFKSKTFNIKASNFEIACERKSCESYLDQHISEIIYCLECIAKKINFTVVIEDLDRVDQDICVEIFMRLREINNMINSRLAQLKKGAHLRFVYVATDEIIGKLSHSKFADYILPVIPRLNKKTSESIFLDNIKEINTELNNKYNVYNAYIVPNKYNSEQNENSSFISIISEYLIDYRTQYAVLNDYSFLMRMYISSNLRSSGTDISKVSKCVLFMSVYKNFLPDDYVKIRQDKSVVFPDFKPDKIENEQTKEMLVKIYSYDKGIFDINVLFFGGFSRDTVVQMYLSALKNDYRSVLQRYSSANVELIEALEKYCSDSLKNKIIKSTCTTSNQPSQIDEGCCTEARDIIDYLVAGISKEWDWLFCEEIYAISVLEILSSFEKFQLEILYELAGLDVEGDKSIFDKSKAGTNGLVNQRDINNEEYRTLKLGLGKGYTNNSQVRVEGIYMLITR